MGRKSGYLRAFVLLCAAGATACSTDYRTALTAKELARLPDEDGFRSDSFKRLYVKPSFDVFLNECNWRQPEPPPPQSPPAAVTYRFDVGRLKATFSGPANSNGNAPASASDAASSLMDYPSWARRNGNSARCVNRAMALAIAQCITRTHARNRLADRASAAFILIESAAGAALDAAAFGAKTANGAVVATAVSTAVFTGAGNVQRLFPTLTSGSAQSMVSSGEAMALLQNLDDDTDWTGDAPKTLKSDVRVRYSLIHDATLFACPSGF